MSPDPGQSPPQAAHPVSRTRSVVPILIVAAFISSGAVFWVFDFARGTDRWVARGYADTVWFAGQVIRAVGMSGLAVLLWRYAFAIRRHNTGVDPTAARMESARAAVWWWFAVFLVANAVVLGVVVSRPAVQPDKTAPLREPPRGGRTG